MVTLPDPKLALCLCGHIRGEHSGMAPNPCLRCDGREKCERFEKREEED